MLTEVEIKNFRGIPNLRLDNLGKLNVLIGKNDTGKSSILECIYAFKAALVEQPIHFKSVIRSRNRQQHARELWHRYSPLVDPTITMKYYGSSCNLTFHSDFSLNTVDVRVKIDNNAECFLKLDSYLSTQSSMTNQNLLGVLPATLQNGIGNMIFFDENFRMDMDQLEKKYVTIGKIDDVYDSSITDIIMSDYIAGNKRLALTRASEGFFVDGFGDGHKSGFSLLTAANKFKGSIILVEEIETHQHPSSLRDLISSFVKICIANNIQAFITTHSPEVLQFFAKEKECKFFHLKKEPDQILVNQIQHNDLEMWRDIGWDISNFLRYEKYVIVEGVIDEVVLRHAFFKYKGIWPTENGITIVSAGGNNNKQKELLKALTYDSKTVYLQRDIDDKKPDEIKISIYDSFKELQKEGYELSEDGETIDLYHKNSGIRKKLLKKNIILTGEQKLNQIIKHSIEDYLLLILQNDPSILTQINNKKTTLPPLVGQSSKDLCNELFYNYNSSTAEEIMRKAKTIPEELKRIIDVFA